MNNRINALKKLYSRELANPAKVRRESVNDSALSPRRINWLQHKFKFRKWARITLAVLLTLQLIFITYFGKFVLLQQAIFAQGSRVEVEHQRRNNLVPRLAGIAKSYAQHERGLMQYVSDARALKQSSQQLQQILGSSKSVEMERTFSKLIALAERYPDLKAEHSYKALMEKIVTTENRVALARQKYVALINEYNLVIKSFPDMMFAHWMKFEPMEVYLAEKTPTPAKAKRFFFIY